MSCRKGALILLTLVVFLTAVLAPASSDADATVNKAEVSGVTMIVFADDVEMNTLESYPVSIHLYNANASPVTVKITDDGSSKIDLSFASDSNVSSDQVVLNSNGTGDCSMELDGSFVTDKYTHKGDYEITLVMSVMGSGETAETSLTLPVSVVSNYSSGESYNKFMGVIGNDLASPFDTIATTVIVTFLIWIGLALVISTFVVMLLRYLFRIVERDPGTIGKGTALGVFFCFIVIGTGNCLVVAGADEHVVEMYTMVSKILYILLIALIVWEIYKALVTTALQKMEKRGVGGMDTSLIPLFKAVGNIVIVLICIVLILSTFEVNFVTIVASAGLTGLGLSFGIKPAINELFSGLIVLMTRPFKKGDYVTIGNDDRLQVQDIGILRTWFVTGYTAEAASMPNSKIASSRIVNISHRTLMYRNTISIKVPFNSNLTLVKKLMKNVASNHPNVVTDGSVAKPKAVFEVCEDGSAVIVTLAFYVRDYDDNKTTTCQIREGILEAFRERNIYIPLNKVEITIKEGPEDAQ